MAEDIAQKLQAIKEKIAVADRERAAAEARVAEAQKRLNEIDDQIRALGVTPEEAEAQVAQLETQLGKELHLLEMALDKELAAYRSLGV